jgi:hypothetical protein
VPRTVREAEIDVTQGTEERVMKRFSLILSVAALGTALIAGTAFAQDTSPDWADKNGAVGVGGNTTLGGTNGIHVRTYVSPLIGVEMTFGLSSQSVTVEPDGGGGDTTTSATTIDLGLYGTYKLAYWQRGSLSAMFGFDYQSSSTSLDAPGGDSDSDSSSSNLVIGLGLRGEYFPTQYLSLFADAGITIDPIDDSDVDGGRITGDSENNDYSGMDINIGADLWGAAGFTVWFK